MRQEKNELTISLKCQKEQRDDEKSHYTLEEDRVKLLKLVGTLSEEKGTLECSISSLKQEDKQIKLLQGQIEESTGHKGAQTSQIWNEGRSQKSHSLELTTQSCQANTHNGTSIQVLGVEYLFITLNWISVYVHDVFS